MEYICIGKIINTHGIRGEVKIQSYSDFDDLRYRRGNTVYISKENTYIPMKVKSYRVHKGFALVAFEGYENINLVEQYKQCDVYMDSADRQPLEEGEFYRSELMGMTCIGENGDEIGTVSDVEETLGAQNNLRVRREDGSTVLIPYVPAFILHVDKEKKTITVNVMEGLL